MTDTHSDNVRARLGELFGWFVVKKSVHEDDHVTDRYAGADWTAIAEAPDELQAIEAANLLDPAHGNDGSRTDTRVWFNAEPAKNADMSTRWRAAIERNGTPKLRSLAEEAFKRAAPGDDDGRCEPGNLFVRQGRTIQLEPALWRLLDQLLQSPGKWVSEPDPDCVVSAAKRVNKALIRLAVRVERKSGQCRVVVEPLPR